MPIVHPEAAQVSAGAEATSDNALDPILQIERLTFAYPDGRVALRDVSLTLHRGEKTALVGPNGAGKSTLMLHLNGILNAANGAVKVAGLPTSKENLPRIRGIIGLVFQNPDDQLFSPTVFEDVAFGPLHMGLPEDEVRSRVVEALSQVDMLEYQHRLSHHLSVGEKKRIAIATVLSMRPQILALDEPTAGLDPRARRRLIELLRERSETMLVSTHDLLMVRELFPRMIIMDEGRVVADGPTEELLADEPLLQAHGLELPRC
ncbi:MAG: ABC transporter ATP-binding protein [Chloroflexi bacterium]|nr:ABC transporter ATP-binding protein [Chloroflexota bacterium]